MVLYTGDFQAVINVAVLADVPWGRVGQERTLCGVSCGCVRWAEFLKLEPAVTY